MGCFSHAQRRSLSLCQTAKQKESTQRDSPKTPTEELVLNRTTLRDEGREMNVKIQLKMTTQKQTPQMVIFWTDLPDLF